jgi:DNA-binding CsgD family transcriptional regulator
VPLETGVFRGLDLDGIRATLPHWDRYAVELGRFRDVAMQRGGVATDREALPDRGPARRTFEKAFGGGRVRAAALVHLVVRERVVGMVALLRRRGLPFSDEEVSLLRSVAPAIATGDALHQALDGGPRARMPVRLVCRDQRLTERQREIVEHVALGHTNAAIGQALGLSPNTVRNLLAVAMRALGAANRADVVRLAVLSDPGTGSPSQTPEIIPVLDTPRRSRATGSTRRHENVEISPEPL